MNIIFDFDGTLADTLPAARALFDKMQLRPPVTDAEVAHWRGLTLRRVLQEVGIPMWRVPRLLVVARADFALIVKTVEVFKGLDTVLAGLKADGHELFVVSSNSSQNIQDFLKRHKIDAYFDHAYGGASVFGKSKDLRLIIKNDKLDRLQTIYVGDETRDIEAARRAGIRSISVTWGFNATEILRSHNPDFMADTPDDLAQLFKTVGVKGVL